MKIVIAFTILCLSSKLQAQLMTVSAEGGERVIDWTSEKNNLSEDNPFLFGSGCSVGPTKAYVSSCLAAQGNSSYKAKNLFDWDPQTAWVEGKSDYGIGEYFEVDLILGGSGISIFNGYQKSYEAWKNNSRVKKFKVYADGQPVCYVELKDLMGYQTFSLPVDYLTQYDTYRFEIIEVFPGNKYKDVAISEICNLGCCFNSNTSILTSNTLVSADLLENGGNITSIDMHSSEVTENQLKQKISVKHTHLLHLETNSHWIEMTSSHTLYFKDYGFTTLLNILKEKKLKNLKDLENTLEVMIWNEKTNEKVFETITSIDVCEGDFTTFSLLGIDQAETYIINGFVSRSER